MSFIGEFQQPVRLFFNLLTRYKWNLSTPSMLLSPIAGKVSGLLVLSKTSISLSLTTLSNVLRGGIIHEPAGRARQNTPITSIAVPMDGRCALVPTHFWWNTP